MALVTPTAESAPTYPAQAVIDATDLGALAAGFGPTGVISGCQVSALATPGYAVAVTAGAIVVGGVPLLVAATASIAPSAASNFDRRDIVVVNNAGVVSIVTGTPCTVAGWTASATSNPPVKPAVPAGSVLLGEIYIPGGGGNLTATNLVDKTLLVNPGPTVPTTPQAPVSGQYITNYVSLDSADHENHFTLANGTVELVPFYITRPCTINQIMTPINQAGSTGALVRMGIYPDGAGLPYGTPLLDAGTVNATGTGDLSVVTSLALTPGTYWSAWVTQGDPTTLPTAKNSSNYMVPMASETNLDSAGNNFKAQAYQATGVTGALPSIDTLTLVPFINSGSPQGQLIVMGIE